MSAADDPLERFELSLLGGSVERKYGALREARGLDDKVRGRPDAVLASIGVYGSAGREQYLEISASLRRERVVPRPRALKLA